MKRLEYLTKRRRRELVWSCYFMGFGIALHDFAHQVWELRGFHNLLEGGYIGFVVLVVCSAYLHGRELRHYVTKRVSG